MDIKFFASTFLTMLFGLGVFSVVRWLWLFHQARASGLYPDKNKATLFDVRRLILKKEKLLAIRLYAELYNVNFKEAKKAVEELEKSIKANRLS